MRITLVITVLNEAATINDLLESIAGQTHQPDEVVIVDAKSTDHTVKFIQSFAKRHTNIPIRVFVYEGNRSQGRNFAIKHASYDWIAITDAGCMLHRTWLAQQIAKAQTSKALVVAGYYTASPKTPFQAAVVPYVLVMPDKVNPATFLPATRSMLLHRQIWEKLGGFPEDLTVSEDYVFAKRMKAHGITIAFTDKAIVSWLPRKNITEFFRMVSSMAEGDVRGGVTRLKAKFVFVRYLVWVILLLLQWWILLGITWLGYIFWSIRKNVRYAPQAWYWLPLLQVTADVGVMWGTLKGWIGRSGFTK